MASMYERRVGESLWVSYISTSDSERKLPAAMEIASTKISMTPVVRTVSLVAPAVVIPERSPTVETKLSSTPKIKFRKYEVVFVERGI